MADADSPPLSALLRQRRQPGRLVWIGLRTRHLGPVHAVETAELLAERGLEGDRASLGRGGKRQVSLIQAEHLAVIAELVGRERVDPALLRRNLLVAGINLLALRSRAFRVGDCLLVGTGTCDPCSKMESALGTGGYNAMRGHGGIVARVVRGGPIRVGDDVDFAELPDSHRES